MQQYVVANWKMYLDHNGVQELTQGMVKRVMDSPKPLPKLVLCPSHPYLMPVYEHIKGSHISMGAQNCHPEKYGPHTGEVSVAQVKDVNAEYVLVGHSEHRNEHAEQTSEHLNFKAKVVIEHGLIPILCIGETAEERASGKAKAKIAQQVADEIPKSVHPGQIMVAYEPIWCIGSDRTPSKAEIEDMHETISQELKAQVPNGNLIPVLYGGSVHAKNAKAILECKGVHGVLVGRQAVKLEELWKILNCKDE